MAERRSLLSVPFRRVEEFLLQVVVFLGARLRRRLTGMEERAGEVVSGGEAGEVGGEGDGERDAGGGEDDQRRGHDRRRRRRGAGHGGRPGQAPSAPQQLACPAVLSAAAAAAVSCFR
uniref:Uncharacterized protein n=1 Tax=Triticum urartu TaxID=4572 RepID=A0A8R7JXR6_TRIUA